MKRGRQCARTNPRYPALVDQGQQLVLVPQDPVAGTQLLQEPQQVRVFREQHVRSHVHHIPGHRVGAARCAAAEAAAALRENYVQSPVHESRGAGEAGEPPAHDQHVGFHATGFRSSGCTAGPCRTSPR